MSAGGIPYSAVEVGKRVAALRRAFGYKTQGAFAEVIGAKRGEVGAWESGGRRPSLEKAQPMVQRFRITLDWLFLGDPSKLDYDLAVRLARSLSEVETEGQD